MGAITVYKDLTTKKSNYILYTGKKDLLEEYPGCLEKVVKLKGWNISEDSSGIEILNKTHNWNTYWNRPNLKRNRKHGTQRSQQKN